VTSSWFFLSTLNYDARSTTHHIHWIGVRKCLYVIYNGFKFAILTQRSFISLRYLLERALCLHLQLWQNTFQCFYTVLVIARIMYMWRETVQIETEVIGWERTEVRKASCKTRRPSKQLQDEALLTFHSYLRVFLLTQPYLVPIEEFLPCLSWRNICLRSGDDRNQ